MKEKLQARDYRFIVVCLTLLAGAIWFSARNFYRAFPEASIDFRLDRAAARDRAAQFLSDQGYPLGGYRDASSFTFDEDAKTFLEREAGLEKANQLMGTRVRLWRWSFRWFRPQQKEEFRADITPAGGFAGFQHQIAEDGPRPNISDGEARSLAEAFLLQRVHRDPASMEFVESSNVTRPHRVDRVFTWKERDFALHEATNRLAVTMLGNEVGGYSEFLKIPEQWTRDYEKLRSKNTAAQTIDTVAVFALVIGLGVVLVIRVRRQDVRWRRAAVIGVVGMGLSFLASLNEFPLAEFGYPTTDAYGSFVLQRLLQAVLGALAWGGALFVIAAGAEVLYREAFPEKISLAGMFSLRGLRTKRFFLGTILGITLCGVFIAYQTIFYIVAYRYGAWSPADVPYSDLLNTRFPWLFVLFGGYLPAISEEFLFRMFAIPALRQLVRWLPAAVVLAGFIWGFGHAGYPQQPFFIRGLEVGIGGVVLGCIMLRWGILPTLVWHYSVDAMYSAMLLLRSHSLYFKLSGAASAGIFLLPVAAALVAYWRHGGFESDRGLLNGDEAAPSPAPAAVSVADSVAPAVAYRPLSGRVRMTALALFAAGLLSVMVPGYGAFDESPGYILGPAAARAKADAFLREQGIDPAGYRNVTFAEVRWGGGDNLAAKYFLEHRPLASVAHLFEQYRPVKVWATRYFKSLEKEEFLVTVHPQSGRILGYNHQLPEDRAGADLTPDAARSLAATFASVRGLEVASMDLKESDSEKRKARRDYELVWEAPTGDPRNVDDTRYRVEIDVAGDRVSTMRSFWKVPEAFQRVRTRENLISIAVLTLKIAVLAGGLVFGLWYFIRRIRQGLVPWKRALKLALIPTVLGALGQSLSVRSTLYRAYQTFIPFETFTITSSAAIVMGLAFSFVLYCAAAAFLLSCFPEFPSAFRLPQRRAAGVDALILLLLAIGLWHFCHQAEIVLTDRLHVAAIPSVDPPTFVGNPAPALAAITMAIGRMFSRSAILGLLALLVYQLPKRWMLVPLALAAPFVLISEEVRTLGEFGLEYGLALLAVACGLAFCLYFARRNYLAYALALWMMTLYPALAELLHSGNSRLELQGWVVSAVMLAGIAWVVGPSLLQNRSQPRTSYS